MATMKAIQMHKFGGPEVLKFEDVPLPKVEKGDVLIRVHAAGVNPVDWKIREGYNKQASLPMIPGWDFSGVVEDSDGVEGGWKKGDEVYSRPDISRNGAYAEYIVVRASEIAAKPKSVDHIKAAAIPLAGLTAWGALFDTGKLSAGQKILIHGAAGGVGSLAVQFAKWKGAHVIGTASSDNQKFLHEIGADESVDYKKTRFEDLVHDVDMVLDPIGGDTQNRSWQVLKKGGILVSLVQRPSESEAAKFGVRQAHVFIQPNASQLTHIAELIDEGKVHPIVNKVFPLAEAGKAQEFSKAGHARGKIVLRVV